MNRRAALGMAGAGLGLLAAALGLLAVARRGSSLPVYEVQIGSFVHRVEAEGVLVAEEATLLTAPMSEEQLKIAWLAPDGSEVQAGDVVIRFDPTQMRKELFDGEADRAKADNKLRQKSIEQDTQLENLGRDEQIAERQLRYAREFQSTDEEIFSRSQIVESQIDEALAEKRREHAQESKAIRGELGTVELDLLELEKRKAQLTIDKAQHGLQELEIRAPHDGIFVLRRDWGEPPSIGQVVFPSMPLAEIPQLDAMKAQVFVLEADAGGVEPGIPAQVRLEAHPDTRVAATVRRVAAVAKRRSRWSPVQYFEVELALEHTDPERMKPGQRVRATLQLQNLSDVITVPREALFADEHDAPFVYVRHGAAFTRVPVTVGATALGRVVIEQGLQVGDLVALEDPTLAANPPASDSANSAPAVGPGGTR